MEKFLENQIKPKSSSLLGKKIQNIVEISWASPGTKYPRNVEKGFCKAFLMQVLLKCRFWALAYLQGF